MAGTRRLRSGVTVLPASQAALNQIVIQPVTAAASQPYWRSQ